jgi:dolichol-phosphate mannosyltransferase
MKVSVVIPVYNEFRTFPQVLARVLGARLPAGCEREIIVIDDGSTDGTGQILREEAEAGVIIVRQTARNLGKGSALRTGIELATGEILLTQDGDLEYDPGDYARLIEPILRGEADIVYGSRFRGEPVGMAWKNRLANRILTFAANLLYGAGITDEATAYKAFRISILRGLRLNCRRFEFCPEVTAKVRRLGYAIHEVPIRYNARGIADGKKIRTRDGFEALWTLVRYRFGARDWKRPLGGVVSGGMNRGLSQPAEAGLQAESLPHVGATGPSEMGRCWPGRGPVAAAAHPVPSAIPSGPDSGSSASHSRPA